MLDYLTKIKTQDRRSERPKNAEALLLHPIADDPTPPDTESYSHWEFDHASQRRFYVGGFLWFLSRTGMNANSLAAFKDKAVEAVADRTTWEEMPNSGSRWNEKIARQQFNLARNHRALFFQKAAIIIMACELAVEELLKSGREIKDISGPEDVYKYMSIIPACWNVDEFNEGYLNKLENVGALDRLREVTGQRSKAVYHDLANGHTSTFETAKRLREALETELDPSSSSVGRVRARPGRRKLGKLRASEFETADFG